MTRLTAFWRCSVVAAGFAVASCGGPEGAADDWAGDELAAGAYAATDPTANEVPASPVSVAIVGLVQAPVATTQTGPGCAQADSSPDPIPARPRVGADERFQDALGRTQQDGSRPAKNRPQDGR